MYQIAVFVDAGYLYAQGSALLAGQKQSRSSVQISVTKVLAELSKVAEQVAPTARLLRVYWYDGLIRGGKQTSEQEEVANSPRTKLRLGMVNSKGEQKGVDSLIVTDLIDLARNRAITDALILSGDEDIRVGVQISQTFGVQTHLLGIKPARGSQSPDLIQESDTHHEWPEEIVASFMTVSAQAKPIAGDAKTEAKATEVARVEIKATDYSKALVEIEIKAAIVAITDAQRPSVVSQMKQNPTRVPPDLDRPTLARLRTKLCRDLDETERREYREMFRAELLKLT